MTIICSACGSTCTGEVLKVQDKHFHINCFKCKECGCLLASGGYFPRNDYYYCSKDYHRLFGTRCKACGEFVEGRVITALGNSYHPECFTCDRCSGEIRSGTVVTYNDKEEILCENCSPDVTLNETPPHNVSSPPPPAASHSPRDNRDPSTAQTKPTPPPPAPPTSQNILETSTNNINSNGSSSSNSISTKKNKNSAFTSSNEQPSPSLSSSRFTAAGSSPKPRTVIKENGTPSSPAVDDVFDFSKVPDIDSETRPHLGKCAQCQDVIRSAQSLIALSRHWHLFCFSCARCKRYLTNEYMDNGDQAFCEPCFQELYGLICETCEDYITGTVLEAGDFHFHPACAFCSRCNGTFTEGDDLCISSEAVWHLDCDRAKGTGIAVAGSLPPSAIPPPTSTTPITSSIGITEVTNKTTSYSNKTSKPLSDVRPASENYARNVRSSSSRSSSHLTPDSLNPPVVYPLKDLQLIGKVCLPKSVNRTKLEQHLSDTDFLEAFGIDRSTFYSKPQWKQNELKKKANLF